jgi:hypothetical protein
MSSDFQLWLNQPVWVNGVERVLRREYIPVFAKAVGGLLKSRGYVMAWNNGALVIARWMYTIQRDEIARGDYNSDVAYPEPLHRDWEEDSLEFQYVMDYDTISRFMDTWKLYEDFDQDRRVGQRMLHELQYILYPYLDLDNSRRGRIVAEAVDDTDSDSDSWKSGRRRARGTDAYLLDASEGFHR